MDFEKLGEDNIDEELSAFMKKIKIAVASRSVTFSNTFCNFTYFLSIIPSDVMTYQSTFNSWISESERDETHYGNQNIQMNPQNYLFYHISRGTYRQIHLLHQCHDKFKARKNYFRVVRARGIARVFSEG